MSGVSNLRDHQPRRITFIEPRERLIARYQRELAADSFDARLGRRRRRTWSMAAPIRAKQQSSFREDVDFR